MAFRNTSPPVHLSVRIRHSAPQCEEHKTAGKTKDTQPGPRPSQPGPNPSPKPAPQIHAPEPAPHIHAPKTPTKQRQRTPVAGAVALACLSHKRSDTKGGRLLSHAVARALALGHVYQERDHGSLRLIKREEAARASLHMASPQSGQLPLPALPTPTRMAGSKTKKNKKKQKKALSLSHQIAGPC